MSSKNDELSAEAATACARLADRLVGLLDATQGRPPLFFCSLARGEGTTSILLEVARALAKARGKRVLVVDEGDGPEPLRARVVTERSAQDTAGSKTSGFEILATEEEGVSCALPLDGAKLHEAARELGQLTERMADRFDVVLVDFGSLDERAILSPIRECRGKVVVVVECDRHRAEVVNAAIERVENVGVEVLGVVLNKRRNVIPGFLYRRL